jgi:hypothetical protein
VFNENQTNADGFESVRCGSDVRKALLGRKMSNEKIVVLEERHKDLGLKDLGASEISDHSSRFRQNDFVARVME